jgi:recombination protein RecA
MSQALRKLAGVISKSKTIAIFTNQLRQKIGIMFGNPETTPGGLALKFYASVRLDTRKIETIKEGEQAVGSRHRVTVRKNKVAPPFRIAELDILNTEGISQEGNLLDVGVELGVIQKQGAFLKFGTHMLGQGKEAARIFLKESPRVAKELLEAIWKQIKSGKALPKEIGEKAAE